MPAIDVAAFSGVAGESKVSMHVLRGLLEAAAQAGVAPDELLRAARLDARALAAETSFPRSTLYVLSELAVSMTRDPALGLHWGENVRANTFNPISHLLAHSPTLRDALQALAELHRLFSSQAGFHLAEHDTKVTLRQHVMIGASPAAERFASELLVAGVYKLVQSFGPNARPERVCFTYPAPAYRSEYTRLFDATERFDQAFTGLVFDQALLDLASPDKDADVFHALRGIAERRIMRAAQRVPFATRVRDALVQRLENRRLEMDEVARSLGVSKRTLRRRLVAEGTSYVALVNEAQGLVAKRLLQAKQLSIQEAAFALGFADTRTFHRAFKRWTGMTPSAFREMSLEDDSLASLG
jgi:AraC-like DNA-binding protein